MKLSIFITLDNNTFYNYYFVEMHCSFLFIVHLSCITQYSRSYKDDSDEEGLYQPSRNVQFVINYEHK